jgi:hypothetical protein
VTNTSRYQPAQDAPDATLTLVPLAKLRRESVWASIARRRPTRDRAPMKGTQCHSPENSSKVFELLSNEERDDTLDALSCRNQFQYNDLRDYLQEQFGAFSLRNLLG